MAKTKKKKISKPVKKESSFDKNARTISGLVKAKLPTIETLKLQIKSDKFNAQYAHINDYCIVDILMLEKVYLRGSKGLIEMPQDRVDQFMYLVRSGKPLNPEYTQDFDLLPEGHPKRKI